MALKLRFRIRAQRLATDPCGDLVFHVKGLERFVDGKMVLRDDVLRLGQAVRRKRMGAKVAVEPFDRNRAHSSVGVSAWITYSSRSFVQRASKFTAPCAE